MGATHHKCHKGPREDRRQHDSRAGWHSQHPNSIFAKSAMAVMVPRVSKIVKSEGIYGMTGALPVRASLHRREQSAHVDLDRVERRDAGEVAVRPGAEAHPGVGAGGQGLNHSGIDVDQPVVRHPRRQVPRRLGHPVVSRVPRVSLLTTSPAACPVPFITFRARWQFWLQDRWQGTGCG